MHKLITGLRKFMTSFYEAERRLFEELARGQRPDVLFITCSDSRVVPNLFTQAKPGELFTIRNAGNIIPRPTAESSAEAGSVEYSVSAIGVKDIIICGHSDCGAMKGLLDPASLENMPFVAQWLEHAQTTRRIISERYGDLDGADKLRRTIEINVLVQLSQLAAHPSVASGHEAGTLRLHGWFYDIGQGVVDAYDSERGQFMPVTQLPHSHGGVDADHLSRVVARPSGTLPKNHSPRAKRSRRVQSG